MAKKCFTCGAELADEAFVCSHCGAIQIESNQPEAVEAQPEAASAAPQAAPAATTAKVLLPKLWMRIVAILAIVAATGIVAWKPLAMLVAPKLVLVSALSNTGEALAGRGVGGPLDLLTHKLDSEHPISTEFEYAYSGPYTNDVQMDLTILSDGPGKQWSINGSIAAGNILFSDAHDISIYGNKDFLAFSSDLLKQEAYYGVEYGGFRQQLEDSIFTEAEDPDPETVTQIEAVLELMQLLTDTTSEDYDQILEPYRALIKDFILDMDCETGGENLTLGSKDYSCRTVTLKVTEKDVSELLTQFTHKLSKDAAIYDRFVLLYIAGGGREENARDIWDSFIADLKERADLSSPEDAFHMDLKFYLYSSKVIYLDVILTPDEVDDVKAARLQVSLGAKPQKDDLRLYFEVTDRNNGVHSVDLRSEITASKNRYQHAMSLVVTEVDDREEGSFVIVWDKETGNMNLAFYDRAVTAGDTSVSAGALPIASLDVELLEEKDSFTLRYTYENEFEQILFPGVSAVFAEKHTVSMSCCNAGSLGKPDYIPLNAWDDDLTAVKNFLDKFYKYPSD